MDFKWLGVVITIFIGLTLICNIMEGTGYISNEDVAILNQQGMTTQVSLGLVNIPIPGSKYINGVIRILDFKEYNDILFTGMAQIIYFAMAGVVFLVLFFLFVTVVGLFVGNLRR